MELQVNENKRLLSVLVFVLIFSVMNAFIFNVALPIIRDEFSLNSSDVSWVLSSYMIIYAIGTVMYGKLADYISLGKLLTYGLLGSKKFLSTKKPANPRQNQGFPASFELFWLRLNAADEQTCEK